MLNRSAKAFPSSSTASSRRSVQANHAAQSTHSFQELDAHAKGVNANARRPCALGTQGIASKRRCSPLAWPLAWRLAVIAVAIAALVSNAAGCKRKSPDQKAASASSPTGSVPEGVSGSSAPAYTSPPANPTEALQRMIAAYQTATSYQDAAAAVLRYSNGGVPNAEESTVAVAMHRPSNELSVHAYQVRIHCKGDRLRARIVDEATNNLDQQVIDAEVPTPLTMEAFLSFPLLADMLDRGLARAPMQLELLYSPAPLTYFLDPSLPKRFTDSRDVDGRMCHGVVAGPPGQPFVFWIDQQDYLLRQLDLPTSAIAQATQAENVELSVKYRQASLQHAPARFAWESPEGATAVKFFVPPPQSLPTELYGKRPADFELTDSQGRKFHSQELTGKSTVLVWFSDHAACQPTLQQLTRIRQSWSAEELAIVAISAESKEVATDAISSRLAQWGAQLPFGKNGAAFARDLEAAGRDVFQVPSVPTLIVLDNAGKLHVFDVGYNPNLIEELDLVLRMLKDNQDVSEQVLQRAANERAAYHQDLIAAGARGIRVEFPVAPRRLPKSLEVTRDWSVQSVKHPGNIAIVPHGDTFRLAVLDGLRTVAVLDTAGELISSSALPLPDGAGVSWLRVSTDGGRYLAGTPGGEQALLLDNRWSAIAAYPIDPLHGGLLTGVMLPSSAETPKTTSFFLGFRDAGLQRVDESPDGVRRTWSNRRCASPLSADVTETGEGWRLLVTDPAGHLYIMTPSGKVLGGPLRAAGVPLYSIHAGRFPHQNGAVLCGISFDALGQRVAVGLDLSLQEQWKFSLPGGTFATPLESVVSGAILGSGHWLIASPNGSIDIVSADGTFRDQFQYGSMIRGLAVLPDGRVAVASSEGVECWSVEPQK